MVLSYTDYGYLRAASNQEALLVTKILPLASLMDYPTAMRVLTVLVLRKT